MSNIWPLTIWRNRLRLTDFSRRPVFKFISKRSGPFRGSVTLTRDRVYILPTKAGLMFALLLLVLLIGSINYEKNLGFILTFLLAAAGNIIMLSTWRNIAGLELKNNSGLSRNNAVFAGEIATFHILLNNRQLYDRYAISVSKEGIEYDIVDCPASSNQLMHFKLVSEKRGYLQAGKFRLSTEFPAGLFQAWTWIDLSMTTLVYPKPDKQTLTAVFDHNESGEHDTHGNGQENFSHLRKYHQGDNINRISWKAAARTDELFSKEFIGAQPVTHWIKWSEINARNNEHRLSIMTALVIKAEEAQQRYGIKLPNQQLKPDNGQIHFHACLSALALFEG